MADRRPTSLGARLLYISLVFCSMVIVSCAMGLWTAFFLLPMYVQSSRAETRASKQLYTNTWLLRFESDLRFNNTETLEASDLKELGASIEQTFAFESGSITVTQANFIPKLEGETEKPVDTQLSNPIIGESQASLFTVQLRMRYPAQCGVRAHCHAVFRNQVSTKFSKRETFYLAVELNNDRVIEVTFHLRQLIEDYDSKESCTKQNDKDEPRDHCVKESDFGSSRPNTANEPSPFLYGEQAGEIVAEDSPLDSEQIKSDETAISGYQRNNQSRVMLVDR